MNHSVFSSASQYAVAAYADYRAFLAAWFQAGGRLRMAHLDRCAPEHILIASKVRDFEMDRHKDPAKYYLFTNGTHALISRQLNILSVKEPLDFSAPPLINREIIRDLKTDIKINPLPHYFSGDIAECLMLTYLLSGADEYNALSLTLGDRLMKEFSSATIKSIIEITRENNHYNVFHEFIRKYSHPQEQKTSGAVYENIQRSKSMIVMRLSKALQTLESREAEISKWTPFNPNPERPPVIMSEREMTWRIAYECMQNKKYPHLRK